MINFNYILVWNAIGGLFIFIFDKPSPYNFLLPFWFYGIVYQIANYMYWYALRKTSVKMEMYIYKTALIIIFIFLATPGMLLLFGIRVLGGPD